MQKIMINDRIILMISCFLCVISQLPELWNNPLISMIYSIGWIGLLFLYLKKEDYRIKLPQKLVMLPIVFDILLILLQFIVKKNYLGSNLFRPIQLCTFISIVGFYNGKKNGLKSLNYILKPFVLGSFILGFSIFNSTFRGVDWQNATGYLYTAKNSAAMIFLISIIIMIIYFKKIKKVIALPLIFFFVILILMLKSRATIISLAIFAIYLIFFYTKKLKSKLFAITMGLLFTLYVIVDKQAYDFLINNIMLNNRGINDMTVFTSGRDAHFELFLQLIPNYFILGTGGSYLESFPLASLLSYGLFVGLIPMLYSIQPFIHAIRAKKSSVDYRFKTLIISINIVMIINSIFEELTPFGPGVKCFVLWLIFGIYIGNSKRVNGGIINESN